MRSVCLFLIFVTFSQIDSAVIYRDQVEKPGHEDQCYDTETNIFYKKGDLLKNKENICSQSKCLGSVPGTGTVRIEVLTCPIVEAGTGCRVVQDLSKPYPECCPRLESDSPEQMENCKNCHKQAAD